MSQLVAAQSAPIMTRDQLELVKRTVANGATDDELALFMHYCNKNGLDPLSKDVYFRKNRNNNGDATISFMTSIDTFRARAELTGQYAGNDDPIFDSEESPKKASVTVYKIVDGQRCAFTASARWDQYYPGEKQGFMWRKMPHLMLGKCAEALALRKAFPKQLGKLYVNEEMEQAEVVSAPPAQATPTPKDLTQKLTAPKAPEAPVIDAVPADSTTPPHAEYVIQAGKKYKGKRLVDVDTRELRDYVKYFHDTAAKENKKITGAALEFLQHAEPYLNALMPAGAATDDIPF